MSDTIISWNFANWVTIFLMAFLGFTVFGFAINAASRMKGGQSANS